MTMSGQTRRLLRHLRWQPFDTTTAEGRADERYRLAVLAIVANVANRGMGMLVLLASVSLTLPYLGAERFGLWMTVASLTAALSFMDLGIGNAMVATVAEAASSPRHDALAGLITRGLILLTGIGLLTGTVLLLASRFVPLTRLFRHLSTNSVDEAQHLLTLFVVLFALSVPTLAVQKIYAGLQQAWLSHAVMACAGLASLLLIVAATRARAPLSVLLLLTFGVQALAPLLLLPQLLRKGMLQPRLGRTGMRDTASLLLRRGSLYFWLQIGVLAGWGADSLLVSSQLAVSEVARLTIVQRLFDFVVQPLSILNAPLWAAYADAYARHDRQFIAQALLRSMRFTLGLGGAGILLILLFYPQLLRLWLHVPPELPFHFVAAAALWALINALGNAWAMYMNGCTIVRPQVAVVIPFVGLSIALKVWWLPVLGITTIPVATALCYTLCIILPYLTVLRRAILAPLATDG